MGDSESREEYGTRSELSENSSNAENRIGLSKLSFDVAVELEEDTPISRKIKALMKEMKSRIIKEQIEKDRALLQNVAKESEGRYAQLCHPGTDLFWSKPNTDELCNMLSGHRSATNVMPSSYARHDSKLYERKEVVKLKIAPPIPHFTSYITIRNNIRAEDNPNWECTPYVSDNKIIEIDMEAFNVPDKDKRRRKAATVPEWELICRNEVLVRIVETFGDSDSTLSETSALLHYSRTPNQMREVIETIQKSGIHAKFEVPSESVGQNSASADITSESVIDSHARLFCFQCYKYDCQFHREKIINREPLRRLQTKINRPQNLVPCGSDCYIFTAPEEDDFHPWIPENTTTTTTEATSNSNGEASNSTVERNGDEDCELEWSSLDKALYNRTKTLFHRHSIIPSPCSLSLYIPHKSCQKVYEYQKQDRNLAAPNIEVKKTKKIKGRIPDGKKDEPYQPCECIECDGDCSCSKNGNRCEKFCNCSMSSLQPSCWNRHMGCGCSLGCRSGQCGCQTLGRECDRDLCGCYCKKSGKWNCQNNVIQLERKSHILMGRSTVHGMGAFAAHDILKKEFIGEYVGELVSHDEGERRGRIIEQNERMSYAFTANHSENVDSLRLGNKTKFLNDSQTPNCVPRVMKVDGEHRIGLWADQDISKGQELFFNYNYGEDHRKDFVETGKLKVPKKRT